MSIDRADRATRHLCAFARGARTGPLSTTRKRAVCIAAAMLTLGFAASASASPSVAPIFAAKSAVIIENDLGGSLRRGVVTVRNLRASGQNVRIVGNVCYSTCTLYLGLPQTCVSPRTIFGFHGPSSHGWPLSEQHFEQASQVIISHYPPILHEWYMKIARYELRGLLKVDGAQLARIGAARLCDDL